MLSDYLYGKIIISIFMLVCAYLDFRKKEIDRMVFLVMLVLSFAGYLWMYATGKQILWIRILIGVGVGALIALLSIVTKGSIGMGDAIYFTLMGLTMGCKTVLVFAGSLALCALISLFICIREIVKGNPIKNKAIPFLPIVFPVGMAVLIWSDKI